MQLIKKTKGKLSSRKLLILLHLIKREMIGSYPVENTGLLRYELVYNLNRFVKQQIEMSGIYSKKFKNLIS